MLVFHPPSLPREQKVKKGGKGREGNGYGAAVKGFLVFVTRDSLDPKKLCPSEEKRDRSE